MTVKFHSVGKSRRMTRPLIARYLLVAEDWTGVGGDMGSQMTFLLFTEYFSEEDKAKKFAQRDYQKRSNGTREPFKWKREGKGWNSGDLSFINYRIAPLKVRA